MAEAWRRTLVERGTGRALEAVTVEPEEDGSSGVWAHCGRARVDGGMDSDLMRTFRDGGEAVAYAEAMVAKFPQGVYDEEGRMCLKGNGDEYWARLVLRQSVSPAEDYEPNPDGSMRAQAVRAVALGMLMGEPIRAKRRIRFLVCKRPLPLYEDAALQEEAAKAWGAGLRVKAPKAKGMRPIEWMWPEDLAKVTEVDHGWYRDMIAEYVMGAFGLESLEAGRQGDLSSWF